MIIQKLHLINFKNHQEKSFEFSPQINCFVGNNGVGKTNVLDALHYLSVAKSFLGNTDLNNIRTASDFFALEAALVLAANDIKVYLFEGLRPTPELSFAVRHLGAVAGINITASHNPPKYNGYKVYWEDGGQIPPHISDSLLKNINNLPMFSANTMDKQKALVIFMVILLKDYIMKI